MNKYAAIFLVFVYLISATEFSQLLRIPLLLKHFTEHKMELSELSVSGFLSMHYFNGNPHDKDFEQDMQLPFKSHNSCINFLSISEPTPKMELIILWFFPQKDKSNFPPIYFYSTQYFSSVWQPPKSC